MEYLKLPRSRLILLSFLVFSILALAFPRVDLAISGLFFDGVSFPKEQWWQQLLHDSLNGFLSISLLSVGAVYAFNRLFKRNVAAIDGRKVLFLVLALAIGAGLIVNTGLKDNFGRARPRDVKEFNGAKTFTPAFVPSRECRRNCSFSSGDAAGGFFAIALAMALTRRRAWYAAAIATGAVMSLGRISSGAHFFSDVTVSFFVMLLVSDVLYFYVVLGGAARREPEFIGPVLEPAYATIRVEPEVRPVATRR